VIRLEQVSKGYGTRILLKQIDFHFPENERLALIGANGAGKSTLLNIIAKVEDADSGSILIPGHCKVAYLPQEPNPSPLATVLLECQSGRQDILDQKNRIDKVLAEAESGNIDSLSDFDQLESRYRANGGYALESRAAGILHGLGFSAIQTAMSPLELSGGWRMRLELAKLFLKDAQFLILDEPTNHLDLPSLIWVENFLTKYQGTLLFVSHDRALLNRLPTQILHLQRGEIKQYKGNFDAFIAAKQLQEDQDEANLGQIRKKKDQLETFVTRFGAKASKAKQAQAKMKVIAKLEIQEGELADPHLENSIAFKLPEPMRGPRTVCEFEDGAIGYGSPLSTSINFLIERGQKIAVIGANGVGKSTLIKTIAGHLAPLDGKLKVTQGIQISYFSQDQLDTLDPNKTVLENVLASSNLGQSEARSVLGSFLFRNDDVFKLTKVLSGGEKGRLGLACVLVQNANFLLLDEPTNHLDMTSVEALTAAVQDYQGTVFYVSHDRTFIDATSTHILAMLGDGRSMIFEGNLVDYVQLAGTARFPNVLDPDSLTIRDDAVATNNKNSQAAKQGKPEKNRTPVDFKELSKKIAKVDRQIEKESDSIEQHKRKIHEIDQLLVSISPSNFTELANLHDNRGKSERDIEDAELVWLSLLDEKEGLQDQLRND
jgi:ATP-binding cassette subfamily F protein 3